MSENAPLMSSDTEETVVVIEQQACEDLEGKGVDAATEYTDIGGESQLLPDDNSLSGNDAVIDMEDLCVDSEAALADNLSISAVVESSAMENRQPSMKDLLPETVVELTGSEGQRIYVVGTAHFSRPSIEDVRKTIDLVTPNIVMLELCHSRVGLLSMDEQSLLADSQNMSLEKARDIFRRFGYKTGVFYLMMVSLSAGLTKKLGMVPGGEFRKAVEVASGMKPMPEIVLIDRDISITISRAFRALSPWGKLKLAAQMLFTSDNISEEEVEKCKQKDVMELALADISREFPGFGKVFIQERDEYLAYGAYNCFRNLQGRTGTLLRGPQHCAVVVMGIGHVAGVRERWGSVDPHRYRQLHVIPPESLGNRVAGAVCRAALYGAALYVAWRLLPRAAKGTIAGGVNAVCAKVTERLR